MPSVYKVANSLADAPASGFTGSVMLPYSVEDNDGVRQAFINLEVIPTAENDAPVAQDLVVYMASGEPVNIAPEYSDVISGGVAAWWCSPIRAVGCYPAQGSAGPIPPIMPLKD